MAHQPVDAGDGTCSECGRPLATYDKLEHRRGRVRGQSPARRVVISSLPSLEEMLAAGRCDCGQRLEHDELPPTKPLAEGRPCARLIRLGWGVESRSVPIESRRAFNRPIQHATEILPYPNPSQRVPT